MSTRGEVYAHAPITEAVLDIRVRAHQMPDLAVLSEIRDDRYPDRFRQPFQLQVRIQGGDSPEPPSLEHLSTPLGAMYRNEDQKQVFQARIEGFTFNRLAPYENWASFSKEARRLWAMYSDVVGVDQIEAIGLTYINEILIPLGTEFDAYFNTYIEVAKEIPQTLDNFSFSFQVTLPEDHGILAITQGYGQPRAEGSITTVLTIQATKMLGTKVKPTDDELWTMFEHLREAKSNAFEACITDAVREMIR